MKTKIEQSVENIQNIPCHIKTHSKHPLVTTGMSVYIYRIPETDDCLVSFLFSKDNVKAAYLSTYQFASVMEKIEGLTESVVEHNCGSEGIDYGRNYQHYAPLKGFRRGYQALDWHRMTILPGKAVMDLYLMLIENDFRESLGMFNVLEIGIRVSTHNHDFITFL